MRAKYRVHVILLHLVILTISGIITAYKPSSSVSLSTSDLPRIAITVPVSLVSVESDFVGELGKGDVQK